jgi:formate hydrogenlyase subunit 6/NADH:ubiquinone oxidoreductase subunit I
MPPSLTIADAILAMEGEGPSSGKPIALNFMAASADPFALDLTLCDVLRINPERVPYLTGMSRRPAYTSLAVHGEQPEVKRFRLPRHTQQATFSLLPGSLVRLVGKFIWVRPSFSSACVRCGKCVTACPVEALSLPANNTRPRLKAKTCIGCCCCHEVCPARAITMRPSLLLRIARRSSSFSHRSVTTNAGSSTRS